MKIRILSLSLLILSLTACAVAGSRMAPEVVMEKSEPMAWGAPADSYELDSRVAILPAEGESTVNAVWSSDELQRQESYTRMVIKNAFLSIVVDEPGVTMDAISKLASEMGGFVVSSNFYKIQIDGGLEVPQANITIRVPVDKLDQALAEIKKGAGQILNENVSGQDVTQEYTDLESRLRNLQKAEAQLTEIMEQAYKTEDVLTVYNRLVEVQEQIELIKGQMQYYEQSAALSAISVDIQANEAVQPLKIGGWQPVGVAKNAIQALINTLEVIVNILIWMGLYILPIVLILFFPARWIWNGLKKVFARRREKREQKKAEKEKTE